MRIDNALFFLLLHSLYCFFYIIIYNYVTTLDLRETTKNQSLNRDEPCLGVSKEKIPYLIFDYTITTNQFHGSNYRKQLSKDRIRLHKEIMKLYDPGRRV